jgi:hypothetical protein
MYNTKVVCTYNSLEIFTDYEKDFLKDTEKDFVRDVIYRQELLDILGIDDYNEKNLDKEISNLYELIKNQEFLKECMTKIASNFMNTEEKIGLMLLFSYDYLYLIHTCISEFLDTNKISDKSINNLRSIIF